MVSKLFTQEMWGWCHTKGGNQGLKTKIVKSLTLHHHPAVLFMIFWEVQLVVFETNWLQQSPVKGRIGQRDSWQKPGLDRGPWLMSTSLYQNLVFSLLSSSPPVPQSNVNTTPKACLTKSTKMVNHNIQPTQTMTDMIWRISLIIASNETSRRVEISFSPNKINFYLGLLLRSVLRNNCVIQLLPDSLTTSFDQNWLMCILQFLWSCSIDVYTVCKILQLLWPHLLIPCVPWFPSEELIDPVHKSSNIF